MTKIYAQPSPVVKAMTTILFIHAQPSPGVVADIHKTQQPIAVLALYAFRVGPLTRRKNTQRQYSIMSALKDRRARRLAAPPPALLNLP
jgi:hypothetical protein